MNICKVIGLPFASRQSEAIGTAGLKNSHGSLEAAGKAEDWYLPPSFLPNL